MYYRDPDYLNINRTTNPRGLRKVRLPNLSKRPILSVGLIVITVAVLFLVVRFGKLLVTF